MCYDFNADGIRFVMDNEIIVGDPYAGYNGGIKIQSRLSVYERDVVYRTDYLIGSEYVMDYRSPMWVERRIFNLLHDKMDSINNGCYDHSKCPFSGSGISHYEEMDNGTYCWHEDVYG